MGTAAQTEAARIEAARTTTARQRAADVVLAALATGTELAVSLGAVRWHGQAQGKPGAFGILLLIVGGVALLARRRYPVAVLAVVLAATLGAAALGAQFVWPGLIVAFFTAVLRRRRAAAVASLVIGYGASVRDGSAEYALLLAAGLVTLLSVAELSRALADRAAADRHGRAEAAARRASEERLAIARDLHDVVAHSIAVINVQSNTALHLMDRQPERAREALTAIREVSGQTLKELGAVLGALRAEDGPAPGGTPARDGGAPLTPGPGVARPGVARLGELTARARSAGFAVSLDAEGTVRDLPAGVDAAAYRIVQEALTNTVRHSGGRAARVRLRYGDSDLEIEVADDGAGKAAVSAAASGARGSGNGLVGMAERARALGGTLTAGPAPGGGFRVVARLPA